MKTVTILKNLILHYLPAYLPPLPFPTPILKLVFSLSVILCLSISPFAFAETINPKGISGEIEVNIQGNSRTKKSLIKDLVQNCLEDEKVQSWQEITSGSIEQCLLNSKLFAQVQASIQEPVIIIELEERWTLLPIPYVFSSGDDYTFGIFLMESNVFGLGKKAGIGGSLSSNGSSYFLYYFDPSILFSDWTTSFRIGNKVMEPMFEHDDHDYYSYEVEEFSYGLNIGRKILLPELWLSLGFAGEEKSYEQVDSYLQPEDYDSFSLKTRILYKDTDFKFYFNEGLQINFEFDVQAYRSDENSKTSTWNLTVDWQKKFIRNNAIQLKLQLQEISEATLGDPLLLGRSKGFRGIENQGLWVKSAQSLSIDYQIPIKSYGYGTWTISPFVDLSHFDPVIDIPADSFISCGIGGSLFLKNIAFPGIALYLGYNNEFKGFFVSFSLGMKF